MSKLIVANTIRNQLGGGRFSAMTGAKDFVGGENFLQFKLPSKLAKNKINFVKITLTPMDVYTVDFMNLRGMTIKSVSNFESVYCDELQSLFESETGLFVKL